MRKQILGLQLCVDYRRDWLGTRVGEAEWGMGHGKGNFLFFIFSWDDSGNAGFYEVGASRLIMLIVPPGG